MKTTALASEKKSSLFWRPTRRGFLIGTGTIGALAVGACALVRSLIPLVVDQFDRPSTGSVDDALTAPLLWFALDQKHGITLYLPKGEMGQGIHSAVAQLAAEELEILPSALRIEMAASTQAFGSLFNTYGSRSMRTLYAPTRKAAAMLREMLRIEAAMQLQVEGAALRLANGVFVAENDPAKRLSYQQIVAAKKGAWVVPEGKIPLKPREKFKLIGTNTARVDTLGKVVGSTPYGISARLPGMLFGALVRPPRLGAVLVSVRDDVAKNMPGVKKVVVDLAKNFAGVVAETRTQARNAAAALGAQYTGGSTMSQAELEKLLTATIGDGTVVRSRGKAAEFDHTAINAAYRSPAAAHAHLEPLTALVDVRATSVEAWLPTQSVAIESEVLEAEFGGKKTVQVHGMQMGGSFGRKGFQSAVLEAARLSAAVGAPVSVAWTREEEMRHSFYRQPAHIALRGRVNSAGKIDAIEQAVATANTATSAFGPGFAQRLLADTYNLDIGAFIGLFSPYAVANYRATMKVVPLPIPTGIWRGVGLLPNVFATESFADELAVSAKIDPLKFRMDNLPATEEGAQLKAALEMVAAKSGWATPPPPNVARGVACCLSGGAAIAMVAEVQQIGSQIVLRKFTAVVDAGLIVNPVGAALQVKGCIVMGASSALFEKITINAGAVEQANFDTYAIARLSQIPPQISVHFIDSPRDPQGMGEPAIGPVAPAIANAIFALTGKRQRELPLMI